MIRLFADKHILILLNKHILGIDKLHPDTKDRAQRTIITSAGESNLQPSVKQLVSLDPHA